METFDERSEASQAAASFIAEKLRVHLATDAAVSLVVSGGSTPVECLDLLSRRTLDWHRVFVTLTDERVVDPTDERSNERMVREHLLEREAASATFLPLRQGELPDMPMPAACSLVGMGTDGHFASLFPDLPRLDEWLEPDGAPAIECSQPAPSEVDRLTMTLGALLETQQVLLLAFGEDKRCILERPANYPVGSLFTQSRVPVTVFWAP